jgi:hypothetical protein
MNQKNILVPTRGTDEWRQLLADPDRHWKVGASAQTLAESWERPLKPAATGLPRSAEYGAPTPLSASSN